MSEQFQTMRALIEAAMSQKWFFSPARQQGKSTAVKYWQTINADPHGMDHFIGRVPMSGTVPKVEPEVRTWPAGTFPRRAMR